MGSGESASAIVRGVVGSGTGFKRRDRPEGGGAGIGRSELRSAEDEAR